MSFNVPSFTVTALSTELCLSAVIYHSDYICFQGVLDISQTSSRTVFVLNIKAIHKFVSERETAGVKLRKRVHTELPRQISKVTQVEKFNNPALSFYKLQTIATHLLLSHLLT